MPWPWNRWLPGLHAPGSIVLRGPHELASLRGHFSHLAGDAPARARAHARALGRALVSLRLSGDLDRDAGLRRLRRGPGAVDRIARARIARFHVGPAVDWLRPHHYRQFLGHAAHTVRPVQRARWLAPQRLADAALLSRVGLAVLLVGTRHRAPPRTRCGEGESALRRRSPWSGRRLRRACRRVARSWRVGIRGPCRRRRVSRVRSLGTPCDAVDRCRRALVLFAVALVLRPSCRSRSSRRRGSKQATPFTSPAAQATADLHGVERHLAHRRVSSTRGPGRGLARAGPRNRHRWRHGRHRNGRPAALAWNTGSSGPTIGRQAWHTSARSAPRCSFSAPAPDGKFSRRCTSALRRSPRSRSTPSSHDIVSRRMRDFFGRLFEQPGVSLVTEEGRSFVRRSQETYDAIISVQTDEQRGTHRGCSGSCRELHVHA